MLFRSVIEVQVVHAVMLVLQHLHGREVGHSHRFRGIAVRRRHHDDAAASAAAAEPDIVVPDDQIRSSVVVEVGLADNRSEEHTSELQSLMRISYAVFCLTKKKINKIHHEIQIK